MKVLISVILLIAAISTVNADPCPAGWRGIAPNCISLASLVTGRGPCAAAISDDFTTVSITCPCLGDPTDPTYNIGLHLYASQPSNSANVMSLVPATTSMQGQTVAAGGTGQFAQIAMSMPLTTFRGACDYASPATSVDVYRTNIALKLQQNNTANGILDTLFTVNYRVMLTVNRLVTASSGVYVAQTVDGEDISATAKALVGVASWCANTPVPAACTYKSNVFQAGSIATMQFGLVSSTLPTFIQSGQCNDFNGNSVWSITSGWSRYANGAGAASVSFAVPNMPTCVQFLWTASVPALTSSGDFAMQSITVAAEPHSIASEMSTLAWYNGRHDGAMRILDTTPTVGSNLTFVFEYGSDDSNDTSTDTSSSSSSSGTDSSDAIARSTVTIGLFSACFFVGLSIFKQFF